MAKNSKARIDANNNWNAKSYDDLKMRVKKGQREQLKQYAEDKKTSLNNFLCSCVSHCIENDVDISKAKPLSEILPEITE